MMFIKSVFVLFSLFNITAAGWAEVPEIHNPATAPATRVIEMQEVWRIGNNEDEPFVLGVITRVVRDSDGNIYLLDSQQNEIFKFSREGEYLKSVARSGEGPGELSSCFFCTLWDDQTLGCLNGYPQSVVRVDLEGIPAKSFFFTADDAEGKDQNLSVYGFQRRDGHMVGHGGISRFVDGRMKRQSFLSSFQPDGRELFCFDRRPAGYDFHKPITVDEEKDFWPYGRWALGRDGDVFTAPSRDEYLIEVRGTDGQLRRRITRPWTTSQRTDEEKEEAKKGYTFSTSGMDIPPITYKMSDHDPAIQSLRWVDDHLWVQDSRLEKAKTEDQALSVAVFSPHGEYLENRIYEAPVDPEKDRFVILDAGHAVVIKNIEAARRAMNADLNVQVGEERQGESEEDDLVLEVIFYQAVD